MRIDLSAPVYSAGQCAEMQDVKEAQPDQVGSEVIDI